MTDRLCRDARTVFEAGVRAVQADRLLEKGRIARLARRPLDAYDRVVVTGMGKASMAMAGVVEQRIGRVDAASFAVVPHGYRATLPAPLPAPSGVAVVEAGHPVPDVSSVRAGERLVEVAAGCGEGDLLVVLVSGGGTALCTAFADGVTLEDAQRTYALLLGSGVDIHAMNAVRKHLSRLGGGQLARAAHPAEVVALVVSDVVGDDLATVASGPTVPDPSTYADAVDVLQGCGVWEAVPPAVRTHFARGRRGEAPETPGAGEPVFGRVTTRLIGSNRQALQAARAEAERCGYHVREAVEGMTGEARDVGRAHGNALRAADVRRPACLLYGGETTVTVRGDGRGGRNQEAALAAALALDGAGRTAAFLSAGTDGIDGPTDAAGAVVTTQTVPQARAAGRDAAAFLDRNDSYAFFEAAGGLLRTGPTHTNVMDLQVGLIG